MSRPYTRRVKMCMFMGTNHQARYRARHPDRALATAQNVEARTLVRASVRFMVGRYDDLLAWLDERYGGHGGPHILAALEELRSSTPLPPPRSP